MQLVLGADYLATGHYAQVVEVDGGVSMFVGKMKIKIKLIS